MSLPNYHQMSAPSFSLFLESGREMTGPYISEVVMSFFIHTQMSWTFYSYCCLPISKVTKNLNICRAGSAKGIPSIRYSPCVPEKKENVVVVKTGWTCIVCKLRMGQLYFKALANWDKRRERKM